MLSVVQMICRMVAVAAAAAGLDTGTVVEDKDEKVASS